MKKLAFSVLAAVLLFSACKKDDNDTIAGSFKFNDTTVATNFAYIDDFGTDGFDISLGNVSPADSNYTGKFSYVQFSVATLTPGTYTFLSRGDEAYDATKNFSYADCIHNMNIKKGEPDDESGTQVGDITAGTVVLKKDGDTYTFTYTFQFGTDKVVGSYTGKPGYEKHN